MKPFYVSFFFYNSVSPFVFLSLFLSISWISVSISKQIKKCNDAYHIMKLAGFMQVVSLKCLVTPDVIVSW